MIAKVSHVHRDDRSRAPAAAAAEQQVAARYRVREGSGLDVEAAAPTDNRTTALELVHGEVDALMSKRLKCGLQPVSLDQALEIAVLTSSQPEQVAIGTASEVENSATG